MSELHPINVHISTDVLCGLCDKFMAEDEELSDTLPHGKKGYVCPECDGHIGVRVAVSESEHAR